MDAPNRTSRFSRTEWCLGLALVFLLVLGLWQGYGAWLIGGGDGGNYAD